MKNTVFVDRLTDGILDPDMEMLGPVKDGGIIMANTAPGCWGPMITPELKGGHEVTRPVYVENAEVGDSIAIIIESIDITSEVVATGTDEPIEGRFNGDPFIAGICPKCNETNPKTTLEGTGKKSVRCIKCGEEIAPFKMTNGYTMAFSEDKTVGVTLDERAAKIAAEDPKRYMRTPDESIQNPILNYKPTDIVGNVARLRPFLGQLGTLPSKAIPDSHNAGDFGMSLIDASNDYPFTIEELDKHRTDGHMDINKVRAGAVLIAPVKVKGGGVYVGDAHAMQGEGEIGGHTCDVAAIVTLRVKVIKGLNIDGPILIPREEDLPYLAKPLTCEEKRKAKRIAKTWDMDKLEDLAPISFIGSGANLNIATDNALERASKVLNLPLEEIKNRTTTNGAVEIGRYPGTVIISFLAPVYTLKNAKLYDFIENQYNL